MIISRAGKRPANVVFILYLLKSKMMMAAKFLLFLLLTGFLTINAKAQQKTKLAWPAKLDAVAAAPKNHQIVFEDANVRVLKVISPPGNEEPVHTHQYPSTMWFTHSAHFVYYTYTKDSKGHLVKKDSAEIKGFPAEALNKGQKVEPEGPHSIKNIGNDTLMAYRIEYKKGLKK